jgi:hypothetical protein
LQISARHAGGGVDFGQTNIQILDAIGEGFFDAIQIGDDAVNRAGGSAAMVTTFSGAGLVAATGCCAFWGSRAARERWR